MLSAICCRLLVGAGRPATGRPGTGRPATGRPGTGRPATGRPDLCIFGVCAKYVREQLALPCPSLL
eukprot:13695032-Heterocapsa_arctica.AAC.1